MPTINLHGAGRAPGQGPNSQGQGPQSNIGRGANLNDFMADKMARDQERLRAAAMGNLGKAMSEGAKAFQRDWTIGIKRFGKTFDGGVDDMAKQFGKTLRNFGKYNDAMEKEEQRQLREKKRQDDKNLRLQEVEERRKHRVVEQEENRRRQERMSAIRTGVEFGGVVGALTRGNVGASISALGGAAGGALGGIVGGPAGAMIGAVIGELVGDVWDMPSKVFSAARPAVNLEKPAFEMGRLGRFSGYNLYNQFRPEEKASSPPWMSLLGLTPERATEIWASMGASPNSEGGLMNQTKMLQGWSLSTAFAGMNPNTPAALLRQGLGFGVAGGANNVGAQGDYLGKFAQILVDAGAKSFDKTKIADNLQKMINVIGLSGSQNIDVGAIAALQGRLQALGGPGGATGSTAAGLVQAFTGSFQNINSNPLLFTMAAATPGFTKSLQSEAGISKLVGSGVANSEIGKRYIPIIASLAKQGNINAAMTYYFQRLAPISDVAAMTKFLGPTAQTWGGGNIGLQAAIIASATGASPSAVLDNIVAPKGGVGGGGINLAKNPTMMQKALGAVTYLMSKGYNHDQAAVMVANDIYETQGSLSTGIATDSKTHAGALHWSTARQKIFQSVYGKPLVSASLNNQLDFQDYELDNNEKKAGAKFKALRNQGVDALSRAYFGVVRPGDGSLSARTDIARQLEVPLRSQALEASSAQSTLFDANNALVSIGPLAQSSANALEQLIQAFRELSTAIIQNPKPGMSSGPAMP